MEQKEYSEMEMGDHVEAQSVLQELERHGCLSKKGKEFKKEYFKDLDKGGYLSEEYKEK